MTGRIGDALRWNAAQEPDKTAIVWAGGSETYGELWDRALRLADGLAGLGLTPGDRLAILLKNSHRYLEVYQAAAILGIAVVPLNTRYVAHELTYVLRHSDARALIFDPWAEALVRGIRPDLPLLGERVVTTGPVSGPGAVAYEDLIARGRPRAPAEPADLSACYFQGYTSGTTGFPKGCVNPHGPFADCLRRMADLYSVTDEDVELVAAPLFHEAPALFALLQLLRGGTVVVTADSQPANLLGLVDAHRVTWTFMVPTMWAAVMAAPDVDRADLRSLRFLATGGSALLTPTKEALLRRLPHAGLNEFYGGTEIGLVTNLGPADQARKTRSVGKPIADMVVEIRDDAGAVLGPGEVGEIYVGGATLLDVYYKDEAATARARHGAFLTLGDLGRWDEEGFLYLVDRKNDMIISGGENIYPNDVEDALSRHPAVEMVAVVGAPHPTWGEVVVAEVVLKAGHAVTEAELIAHAKAALASFKVPKSIVFRDRLPVSAFGKILRREVRAPYWPQAAANGLTAEPAVG